MNILFSACSCNELGTIGNYGCNVFNGECICKRNVIGRDCNQCLVSIKYILLNKFRTRNDFLKFNFL